MIKPSTHQKLKSRIIFPSNTFIGGQHFLKNKRVIAQIIDSIPTKNNCVEIGAGPATLTTKILEHGNKLIAYEIDPQFTSTLDGLQRQNPDQFSVRYQSFLNANNEELNSMTPLTIIGNIPYHISEPLMFKLTEINFDTSTLLVGKKFAHLISSGPDSPNFTRMSLLANAYFNVKLITEVPKSDFEPMPRANGHIIMLTPKTPKQIGATEQAFRSIVEASRNNTAIAHALKSVNLGNNNKATNKQPLGKKSLSHHKRHLSTQLCKNLAQQYNTNDNFTPTNVDKFKKVTETNSLNLLIKAGIDQTILSKPLTGISNHDLRKICQTISGIDNKYRAAHKDSDQSR